VYLLCVAWPKEIEIVGNDFLLLNSDLFLKIENKDAIFKLLLYGEVN